MFIQRGIIENGFDLESAIIEAGHKKKQLSENDSSQYRVEYKFHIEYIQHVRLLYARSYNLVVEMYQYVYYFLTAEFKEG